MEVNTLYAILGVFQLFFVASFILSVKAYFQTHLPDHLKYFFIYPSVALFMIIFLWLDFFGITPRGFFSNLNFSSLIFHFAFLSWFILKVIKSLGEFKIEKFIRLLFLAIVIYSVINDFVNHNNYSYVVINSLLFIYCLFYFGKLFKTNAHLPLTSQPSFWVITGVFVGMGIILPFYVFHEFISVRVTKNTINLLRLIGGVGYATMHLFFAKGLLCTFNSNKIYFRIYSTDKIK